MYFRHIIDHQNDSMADIKIAVPIIVLIFMCCPVPVLNNIKRLKNLIYSSLFRCSNETRF